MSQKISPNNSSPILFIFALLLNHLIFLLHQILFLRFLVLFSYFRQITGWSRNKLGFNPSSLALMTLSTIFASTPGTTQFHLFLSNYLFFIIFNKSDFLWSQSIFFCKSKLTCIADTIVLGIDLIAYQHDTSFAVIHRFFLNILIY